MDWDALDCSVDDFCKGFESIARERSLGDGRRRRKRPARLSLAEMLTIVIGFQGSGFRTFKAYSLWLLAERRRGFPRLISDTRFVEWIPSLVGPTAADLMHRFGEVTGISFMDSTALAVCGNRRITRNRVFRDVAKLGKTTISWFIGFKVHLVIHEVGELLGIRLTPGNVDDRTPVRSLCSRLFGQLFGDKGYLSRQLTEDLLEQGLRLVTGIRKDMPEKLLPLWDKLMLRKRSLIETVIDQLKNISQIEHTRHRSPTNCVVNILAGLAAYAHQPKKPSLRLTPEETEMLKQLGVDLLLVA